MAIDVGGYGMKEYDIDFMDEEAEESIVPTF
jgi:hypothetical protein